MTVAVGPLDISGMFCSQGVSQNLPFSFATEDVLVGSFGQSCKVSSLIVGVQGVHCLVASAGEVGTGNFPLGTLSSSSFH